MDSKEFWKLHNKAEKAQDFIKKFFLEFENHFINNLGCFEISITYCEGDGFLILDNRSSNVFPLSEDHINFLFNAKTEDEVLNYLDMLEEKFEGI